MGANSVFVTDIPGIDVLSMTCRSSCQLPSKVAGFEYLFFSVDEFIFCAFILTFRVPKLARGSQPFLCKTDVSFSKKLFLLFGALFEKLIFRLQHDRLQFWFIFFKDGILNKNAPTLTFGYTFLVVDKLISYQTSLTIGL